MNLLYHQPVDCMCCVNIFSQERALQAHLWSWRGMFAVKVEYTHVLYDPVCVVYHGQWGVRHHKRESCLLLCVYPLLSCLNKAVRCLCLALRLQIAFEDQEREREGFLSREWIAITLTAHIKETRFLPTTASPSPGGSEPGDLRKGQHVYRLRSNGWNYKDGCTTQNQ